MRFCLSYSRCTRPKGNVQKKAEFENGRRSFNTLNALSAFSLSLFLFYSPSTAFFSPHLLSSKKKKMGKVLQQLMTKRKKKTEIAEEKNCRLGLWQTVWRLGLLARYPSMRSHGTLPSQLLLGKSGFFNFFFLVFVFLPFWLWSLDTVECFSFRYQ